MPEQQDICLPRGSRGGSKSIHRRILQHKKNAFFPWLSQPAAVRGKTAGREGRSLNRPLWGGHFTRPSSQIRRLFLLMYEVRILEWDACLGKCLQRKFNISPHRRCTPEKRTPWSLTRLTARPASITKKGMPRAAQSVRAEPWRLLRTWIRRVERESCLALISI